MATQKSNQTSAAALHARRRAGLANTIALLALLACLIPAGTETQGGGATNPPPSVTVTQSIAHSA